jgi:serine/threonine-protein kinase HipA
MSCGHWRDIFFACGVSARNIDYIAPVILPDCFFFARLQAWAAP